MNLNKFFYHLSGYMKGRIISGPNSEPYLERYLVCRFGRHAVFLHRFLGSDPDKGLHDHPWKQSVSLIVAGHYLEKRLIRRNDQLWVRIKKFGVGCLNFINKNDFHQIVLPFGCCAWTLFYHGERIKGWGFAVNKQAALNEEGCFGDSKYELVQDSDGEANSPWEKSAARGRFLKGRMSEDFCFKKR